MSFLLWLLVSSMLYFTERNNPDEELQEVYASVPRALWAEIINLHGEWPWCDYTWQGKAIGTFLNFMSIGICMVPVVVFSDAFMSKVEEVHPAKPVAPAVPAVPALEDGAPSAPAAPAALPDAPELEASEAPAPPGPPGPGPPMEPPEVFRIGDMAAHRWQLRYKGSSGFGLLYSHLLSEKERQSAPHMYHLLRFISTSFILFATFNTVMNSLPSLKLEVFSPLQCASWILCAFSPPFYGFASNVRVWRNRRVCQVSRPSSNASLPAESSACWIGHRFAGKCWR